MPEALLTVLKFFLIALIWLFFLRVLRAVWVEVRRSGPPGADEEAPAERKRSRRSDLRLRVVEPIGSAGQTFELGDEITVGRAAGCGVALEHDTFASKVHARLYRQDGRVWVEDLGSTNGTYLNTHRLDAPTELRKGDRLQVGETVLEVTR